MPALIKSHFNVLTLLNAGYAVFILSMTLSCSGGFVSYEERRIRAEKLVSMALQSHNPSKAMEYLEQAIRHDSLHIKAHLELAELYVRSGMEWKAETVLKKGIQSGIRNSLVYYSMGKLQYSLKKSNESVMSLELILPGDSLFLPASLLLAAIYYEFGNYAQSAFLTDTLASDSAWTNKTAVRDLRKKLAGIPGISRKMKGHGIIALSQETRITRLQLARMFNHFFPVPSVNVRDITFEDIPASDETFNDCARPVLLKFLENLPDRKFYPAYVVKKRNLVYYLINWLKKNNYAFPALSGNKKSWKDLPASDKHYTMMTAALDLGIIKSAGDSTLGADQPVTGSETLQAFEKVSQLLSNQNHGK